MYECGGNINIITISNQNINQKSISNTVDALYAGTRVAIKIAFLKELFLKSLILAAALLFLQGEKNCL